jgi:ferredoxin
VDEPDERRIAGLRVRIDRGLCVGFADCVESAPEAFSLDAAGVAAFTAGAEEVTRARLLAACESCPVDAITVWDESGKEIVPRPRGGGAGGSPSA